MASQSKILTQTSSAQNDKEEDMDQPSKKHLLIPIFITICLDFISIRVLAPV